jgi:hypothetical protein
MEFLFEEEWQSNCAIPKLSRKAAILILKLERAEKVKICMVSPKKLTKKPLND